MTMTIATNNQPRPVLQAWELTPAELAEFDYLAAPDGSMDAGSIDASFFRYKGRVYDLGEFMRSEAMPAWDGYAGDSYFSGVLVRIVDGGDAVIVGRYCC